ncbi:hypothetical protein BST61_g166 [Cercospora zeina]
MERDNRGMDTPYKVNAGTKEDYEQASPSPAIGSASAVGITPRHNSHPKVIPGSPIPFPLIGNTSSHQRNRHGSFAQPQRFNSNAAATAQARLQDSRTARPSGLTNSIRTGAAQTQSQSSHTLPSATSGRPSLQTRLLQQSQSQPPQRPADSPTHQRPGLKEQPNPFVSSHAKNLDNYPRSPRTTLPLPNFATSKEDRPIDAQQNGQFTGPIQQSAPPSDGLENLPSRGLTKPKTEVIDLDSDTEIEEAPETAQSGTQSHHGRESRSLNAD